MSFSFIDNKQLDLYTTLEKRLAQNFVSTKSLKFRSVVACSAQMQDVMKHKKDG